MRANDRSLSTGRSVCRAAAAASAVAVLSMAVARAGSTPEEFSFLFWTDQELVNDDGAANLTRLMPTITAMNGIAGTAYPAAIGGDVATPDFIASGGDTTTWPTHYCVNTVWEDIVENQLSYPTRAVAGNHDSGGSFSSNTFYTWLRNDAFVAAHASDNGQPAWDFNPPAEPDTTTGIIPGINYSFLHKGVAFIMWSPIYDMRDAAAGSAYVNDHDLAWLAAEFAKFDAALPKVVVCHYNGGSIVNRSGVDALYASNNVLLHLCGHWESVQHWTAGATTYVMDEGCRGTPYNASFSVVHFGRDRMTLAHYETGDGDWHALTIDLTIPERWALSSPDAAVTTDPASTAVLEGQTATFDVTATGDAPLSYQWQIDGGAGWSEIGGATDPSYTTPATATGDDGAQFRCVVSNAVPSTVTSAAATLTVNPHTVTVISPDGGTFRGKQDVTVAWTTMLPGDVAVEFSDDGWSNSTAVGTFDGSAGSCVWQLPNVDEAACAIRVSDDVDGDPSDTSVSFAIAAIVDADGDRLDDGWEATHFGDTTTTTGGVTDSDSDGASDLAEFWTGTDPTVAGNVSEGTSGMSCVANGRDDAALLLLVGALALLRNGANRAGPGERA